MTSCNHLLLEAFRTARDGLAAGAHLARLHARICWLQSVRGSERAQATTLAIPERHSRQLPVVT
jgi:hypothetical protein